MQLKELAERSGISSASIKFYRREGLLSPGQSQHPTLAQYSNEHLERLELISALRGVVCLSIAQIRVLVSAIDDPDLQFLDLLGKTQSLVLGYDFTGTAEHPRTTELMARQQWPDTASSARDALNAQLSSMERLGIGLRQDVLDGYADAAALVAKQDLGFVLRTESRDRAVLHVAVGVHHFSKLLVRIIALAQTSESIRKYDH